MGSRFEMQHSFFADVREIPNPGVVSQFEFDMLERWSKDPHKLLLSICCPMPSWCKKILV